MNRLTMIKNLMFDLGGVIMEIRRQNCVEAFKKLGMENPDDFLGEYRQSGPFADIESGADGHSGPVSRRNPPAAAPLRDGLTD